MPSRTALKIWARRHATKAIGEQFRKRRDAAVVRTIQREAKEAGATLAHGGQGGIDPRIALDLFREADWRCSNPKCPDPQVDLDLDHQSGHPKEILEDPAARKDPGDRAAARAGDDPKDDDYLHVICAACHDACHDRERAIEDGEEPDPMPGDKRR